MRSFVLMMWCFTATGVIARDLQMDQLVVPKGFKIDVYAEGLVNGGAMALRPSGELFVGTPLAEQVHAVVDINSMHFGFPNIHGDDSPDPEFGKGHTKNQYTLPAQPLGPHVAALGMNFYTGKRFPEAYRNPIVMPEHGSGHGTRKMGYRLTPVPLDGNRSKGSEVFVEGRLQGETPWGRLPMPDGAMLLSDDAVDTLCRIFCGG